MITHIIDLLKITDFYGVDKDIDIAKGVHKLPKKWSEFTERTKRIKAWQN